MHKKTWKEFGKRVNPYATWYGMWRHGGRFWKRKLSKARRRWNDEHKRGLLGIERECNWKGW